MVRFLMIPISMLVSPVLIALAGLKRSSLNYKRWVLTAFITFFGSIILLSELADGYRHAANVHNYYQTLGFQEFLDGLYQIIIFDPLKSTDDDVYIHILSYFLGFFQLPELFFVLVSFVYGYFFSGSILHVLKRINKNRDKLIIVGFTVLFIIWQSLEGIVTVRTWTGMWILFYGTIRYYETRNWKYLLLMFLPPFIHVGYFILAFPAWIVLFLGNRSKVYSIIFFLSFAFEVSNTAGVLRFISKTQLGQDKIKAYYVDEAKMERADDYFNKSRAWYAQMYVEGFQNYLITAICFLLILSSVYTKRLLVLEKTLFSIGILSLALSRFFWFFFAINNRSEVIGGLFILAALLLVLQNQLYDNTILNHKWIKLLLTIILILFVPYLAYKAANMIYYFSVFMFFFPAIAWIFPDVNMSVRSLIDNLLQ